MVFILLISLFAKDQPNSCYVFPLLTSYYVELGVKYTSQLPLVETPFCLPSPLFVTNSTLLSMLGLAFHIVLRTELSVHEHMPCTQFGSGTTLGAVHLVRNPVVERRR